jgi:hypothetical protein
MGVASWLGAGVGLEAAGVSIDPENFGSRLLPALVIGAVFGIPLGFAQWLVLRPYLIRAAWWVSATALGYAAVFALGLAFFAQASLEGVSAGQQLALGTIAGGLVALPVSVLQWLLVLRSQLPRAGTWIVASVISLAVGFAVSFGLSLTIGGLSFVAGPVVAAAVGGIAMAWLLRQRNSRLAAAEV